MNQTSYRETNLPGSTRTSSSKRVKAKQGLPMEWTQLTENIRKSNANTVKDTYQGH